jgi:hypothetical protein
MGCRHGCGISLLYADFDSFGHISEFCFFKTILLARHWWLTLVILATWEARLGGLQLNVSLGK